MEVGEAARGPLAERAGPRGELARLDVERLDGVVREADEQDGRRARVERERRDGGGEGRQGAVVLGAGSAAGGASGRGTVTCTESRLNTCTWRRASAEASHCPSMLAAMWVMVVATEAPGETGRGPLVVGESSVASGAGRFLTSRQWFAPTTTLCMRWCSKHRRTRGAPPPSPARSTTTTHEVPMPVPSISLDESGVKRRAVAPAARSIDSLTRLGRIPV